MNRLFTYGCSYTKYHWPTWADYLGYFFDKNYNRGSSAKGNRYIFNTITQDIFQKDITKNDTLIIQWSGLGRNDYFFKDGWHCQGEVFDSSEIYNTDYIEKYFSFNHHVTELIGYYKILIKLFEEIGCTYRFIHMMNPSLNKWELMGEPLGVYHNSKLRKDKIKDVVTDTSLLNEIEFFINEYTLSPSIWEYQSYIQSEVDSNYFTDGIIINIDYHPTSLSHYIYVKEILLKDLNIEMTNLDIEHLTKIATEWDSKFKIKDISKLLNASNIFNNTDFKIK